MLDANEVKIFMLFFVFIFLTLQLPSNCKENALRVQNIVEMRFRRSNVLITFHFKKVF